MMFPVVLGSGKRLFGETSDKKTLRLVDSKIRWRRRGNPGLPAGDGRELVGDAALRYELFIKKLVVPEGFAAPTRLHFEHLEAPRSPAPTSRMTCAASTPASS